MVLVVCGIVLQLSTFILYFDGCMCDGLEEGDVTVEFFMDTSNLHRLVGK